MSKPGLKNPISVFLQQYTALLLTLLMSIIGLFTFPVYGVAWDENSQRLIGEMNWKYVFEGDMFLFSVHDGDHGVGFELPLIMIERMLGLKDVRDIFLMRHIVTHLFFLTGAFFCYKLTELLYANKVLSLIAFLLYILHPHIYAHSFFNSKDIPFLTLFLICFYLSAKLLQNKTLLNSLGLGICLGLLINIRIMGVLLLACILLFLLADAIREKKTAPHLKCGIAIVVSTLLILYATWPYLWRDPVENFLSALKSMSHFSWKETNLFDGKQVRADQIGWEYIPLWFSVTMPIPYLLTGLFGLGAFVKSFIRHRLFLPEDLRGKLNLVFFICFIVPLLAVIILKSVLYDGWRHLFFIYPSFIMLIIYGLSILISRYKKATITVSLLTFLFVTCFMVINFPFQHTYFNAFVFVNREPEYIRKHYEMDYWGTSYKQSLEYILANDSSKIIYVFAENHPGIFNWEFLPPEQRARIYVVPKREEATYFITNYRWHWKGYPFEDKKVFSVKVLNSTINAVYKLK